MATSASRNNLNKEEALSLYHFFLQNQSNGKLKHGAIQEAAEKFNVSRFAIWRFHKATKDAEDASEVLQYIEQRGKGRGKRQVYTDDEIRNLVSSLPTSKRGTLRAVSIVLSAYRDVPSANLSKNFMSLMKVMELIMLNGGGNDFKLPHMKKEMRMRSGENLSVVYCDPSAVEHSRSVLDA